MKVYGIDFDGDEVADQVICTPAGAGAWKTICSGGTGFFLAISGSWEGKFMASVHDRGTGHRDVLAVTCIPPTFSSFAHDFFRARFK